MAISTLASAWPLPLVRRLPPPLRRLSTVLAGVFLLVTVVVALFAPLIAPHSYTEQNLDQRFAAPSSEYPLGRDEYGRDVLSRLIYGSRVSLAVAVTVEAVELLFGLALGLWAGLRGGWLYDAVMRLTDLMFAFPDILLAILITGTLGEALTNPFLEKILASLFLGKGLIGVFLALALVSWPAMVRLVRSQALALREREFVEAARAAGASDGWIIWRHLLPNVLGPVVVAATVGMGAVVLAESTLSFLGLGIQEPYPSWGSMIRNGWQFRRTNPMLTFYPAICLAGTIMAFNFLGDGLRDWLDPRSREV